jgi:hypothetical protein
MEYMCVCLFIFVCLSLCVQQLNDHKRSMSGLDHKLVSTLTSDCVNHSNVKIMRLAFCVIRFILSKVDQM